jgi:ankyrin repeat protein
MESERWIVPGGTPLHVAAWNKKPDAIDLLAAQGVDLNARDYKGMTPLHRAVNSGCVASASRLLKHGASSQLLDSYHRTPFMVACETGNLPLLTLLITESGRSFTDIGGQTALHLAARQNNLPVFVFLLDAGWDPYRLDRSARSPVYYALSNPYFAAYMHAKGLDLTHLTFNLEISLLVNLPEGRFATRAFYRRLSRPARDQYINSQTGNRLTPLMQYATRNNVSMLQTLVEAGANTEICDHVQGTALILAGRLGQLASVKCLIRLGAKTECVIDGKTTSVVQAASGNDHVVQWLLVGKYIDQRKITNSSINNNESMEPRPWSGVRQIQIPLAGDFDRRRQWSSLKYAAHLRRETKDQWRHMVPPDWDTIAHMTPLPEELRAEI